MRTLLQSGYVLHTRPYRDSSLLVEFFSRDLGRIALVAKGAKGRKARGGSPAALLQPFSPLACSWSGRSELKTLTACESTGRPQPLRGRRLYSGLYLNELLTRLLHHEDPHLALFDRYVWALGELASAAPEDVVLRQFEWVLLEELGYGFDLETDGASAEPVEEGDWYRFDEQYGMVRAEEGASERSALYLGADLRRIARGDFSGGGRKCAKRLMRQALAVHLGDKPLKSRELFQRPG